MDFPGKRRKTRTGLITGPKLALRQSKSGFYT
jgi:hypothetical protein